MDTAATMPTPTPATERARKPGETRSPALLSPPAPLKASQLPIIRLAASLRDSLSSDNGNPPIAMFVSGRRGAVLIPSFKTCRTLMPAAARLPPPKNLHSKQTKLFRTTRQDFRRDCTVSSLASLVSGADVAHGFQCLLSSITRLRRLSGLRRLV